MKRSVLVPAVALVFVLTGCAGSDPSPTATPSRTATVAGTPTPAAETPAAETPTADAPTEAAPTDDAPSDDAPAEGDTLTSLNIVAPEATGVRETGPGRWEISTSIPTPRGEPGSPEAQAALALCEEAIRLGAAYVSVLDATGTALVLYGDPSSGDACTEV
ncbi:hypothetical protein ACFC3F_11245 [Microbacterium sp. NPDC055910]|uniref:hypothetical protein n=1 Tax=Microbacterium sp. NPDC055910 TaxID=3345659 RepID=UPI0035D7EF78